LDTWIGKECQIGAHSIIMPGVRVGDNCVVAVASVVMKDVPSNRMIRPDFGTASYAPDEKAAS